MVNRYKEAPPAVAFIHAVGIKRGAIAVSVNHDSHNIIAVGADDESICRAVNLVIQKKGAVVVVDGEYEDVLPLPVAGIISDLPCDVIGPQYERIDKRVHDMGSQLRAPYMTMSFINTNKSMKIINKKSGEKNKLQQMSV